MYVACGSIEDAEKVFDKMPVRSVYPWNALLRGNVVLGGRKYREVLGTFSDMRGLGVDLNVYSFSCLIKSFAGASALFQGLKTHGLLIKNGFLGSDIIRTSLIDMYFKCGKVRLAYRVFEEVEERDVVMWGAMIAGFAHNKLQREALEYTRLMIKEGLEVNSVILTTILPVIGEAWASKLGKEVHAYVIKTKEYSKQLFIQSGLVDMYSKCGDIVSGRKVFYGSKERNAISWTALISGYILNGRLEQALRSIVWMQQEGFKPDLVTVATVLPVCGKLKVLKQGKEIHAYAVKNDFLPNASVSTCLMMMYSKCGLLQYSSRVFDSMEKRNVISWTAMMDSYIDSGCLEEALGVFRSMQLSKHRADSVAMGRISSVCGKLRLLKLGREIHGQILKKDLASVPFVSAELVKMYGSCGAIDKSRFCFDAIPVKGSLTWTAIVEAYGLSGQYGEAINKFKQMISKVISFTVLRHRKLKESPHEGKGKQVISESIDFSLLGEAWKPVSMGYKRRWWDCIALPDDVDGSDEASFRMQIKELAFMSLQLLKAAIFDEECKPLFSLEIYGNIIGMFELNNLDLVVESPVEDYFLYMDDLPLSEKGEAEQTTKPILDALGDDYSICCQGIL
ncbi:hypothetical protein K7X08_032417 [Anisodus acutangulus]|uniref:Pentatricopeptide repeat-containing protein n=1 Tax=Anisodus acutangulus TaxID=402998 RepID=A0A9Q1RS63_9SOLA|nr:hypothetical protein K7X08_032417 [Anisodus acutangulus]